LVKEVKRSPRRYYTPKAGFLYFQDEHAIAASEVNDGAIASITPRVCGGESGARFDTDIENDPRQRKQMQKMSAQ